jgi:hypothetical protein
MLNFLKWIGDDGSSSSVAKQYSLRPILLIANTDVSITKMCLDTSMLAKSIMIRRE